MNEETIYCKHCLEDVDTAAELNRYGLCDTCADEYAREFMADLAFEDARCN